MRRLLASEANVEQAHALKRTARWIALPAMLLLVAALVASFDWNWLRGPIGRWAGRQVPSKIAAVIRTLHPRDYTAFAGRYEGR